MPVGKWDLAKLLEVFSKELASREWCQSIKSSEPSSQIIGSQGLNSGFTLHVASENHNRNPPKITCTYCRENHPSNYCCVVTDVLAWKKILQDKSKCYNCLKTGHSVKNCTSQHRCFDWKRKHHIFICESKINSVKKNNASENQAPQNEIINLKDDSQASQNEIIKSKDNSESGTSSTTLFIDHSSKNSFLKIAQALISSAEEMLNSMKIEKRILFDNCSQKFFITKQLKEQLNLKVLKTEQMFIKTFASSEPTL